MSGSHIKSKTIIKMMKLDGTMAKNDADNREVFRVHFDKVFDSPAIVEDGNWTILGQRDEKEAL